MTLFAGLADYVVETEREFVSRVSGNLPSAFDFSVPALMLSRSRSMAHPRWLFMVTKSPSRGVWRCCRLWSSKQSHSLPTALGQSIRACETWWSSREVDESSSRARWSSSCDSRWERCELAPERPRGHRCLLSPEVNNGIRVTTHRSASMTSRGLRGESDGDLWETRCPGRTVRRRPRLRDLHRWVHQNGKTSDGVVGHHLVDTSLHR